MGQPLGRHRGHDRLGLVRGHDLVFEALKTSNGHEKLVDVANGRALLIDVLPLGVWPDQTIEIATLELVGVAGQRFEIGDAIQACPSGEHLGLNKSTQNGETASGATTDGHSIRIDKTLRTQLGGHADAVLDIGDTPSVVEQATIGPTKAARSRVVHVGDGKTPTRPILHSEIERRGGVRGWPAVAHDHQRRLLILRSSHVGPSRQIHKGLSPMVPRFDDDRPTDAEPAGIDADVIGGAMLGDQCALDIEFDQRAKRQRGCAVDKRVSRSVTARSSISDIGTRRAAWSSRPDRE